MLGGMYWSLITPAYAPRWLIIAIRSIALLTAFLSPTLPTPEPPKSGRSWFIAR
jgi:hypothetical protein